MTPGVGFLTRILRKTTPGVIFVLFANVAFAQDAPPANVKPVFVLSNAGDEVQGHLLQLAQDRVVLLVNGTRREFPLDSILRIQISGDPLKNGALIGGVVGLVWCAVLCGLDDGVNGAGYVGLVAFNTGFFALVGAGIDASIVGRTTIYSKTLPASSNAPAARPALTFRLRF
jgi:hypothetical protein